MADADAVIKGLGERPRINAPVQHIELARETVRRFNHRYGDVFPEPNPAPGPIRIMGLDGAGKMSKSKNNTIALFEDALRQTV